LQEVSDMLAGKISNADEDEGENELEALELEINGVKEPPAAHQDLPEAPTDELQRQETQKERWERRQRQQQEERQALVAA
jgi:charged multivesicular body protein 6